MKFKVPKKTIIALVMTAIFAATLTYALLSTTKTIQHTLYIKGFGLSVNEFIDDVTIGAVLTFIDWGESWPDVDLYYNIVIQNVETESMVLEFTNNLSATVRILNWEIEAYQGAGWVWKDMEWHIEGDNPIDGSNYVPGSPSDPLGGGEVLGQRPASPVTGDLGRIRIVVHVSATVPSGPVDPFESAVIGTEVA